MKWRIMKLKARSMWPTLLALVLGCVSARTSSDLTSEALETSALGVIDDFWAAAARGDTATMKAIGDGPRSLEWVRNRRRVSPTYFGSTAGKLEARSPLQFDDTSASHYVLVEVPFVSCPPPRYSGAQDRLTIFLRSIEGQWRVRSITFGGC